VSGDADRKMLLEQKQLKLGALFRFAIVSDAL